MPNHCVGIAWRHVWGERRGLRSRRATRLRLRTKNVSRVLIGPPHVGVTIKSIAVGDVKIRCVGLVGVAVDTARASKLRIEHGVRPAFKPLSGWRPARLDVGVDPDAAGNAEGLRGSDRFVRVIRSLGKTSLHTSRRIARTIINDEYAAAPVVKKLFLDCCQRKASSNIASPKGRRLPALLGDEIEQRLVLHHAICRLCRIYTPERRHDRPPFPRLSRRLRTLDLAASCDSCSESSDVTGGLGCRSYDQRFSGECGHIVNSPPLISSKRSAQEHGRKENFM